MRSALRDITDAIIECEAAKRGSPDAPMNIVYAQQLPHFFRAWTAYRNGAPMTALVHYEIGMSAIREVLAAPLGGFGS